MSLRDELLIPFRGISDAGRSLASGSWVICQCAGRGLRRLIGFAWARATDGKTGHDQLESLGGAALIAVVGGVVVAWAAPPASRAVSPFLPTIGWCATVVWVVAAWIVAPLPEPRKKIVSAGGVAAPPPPTGQAPVLDATTVARAVREVAAPRGWKGAHLDDVLAHFPGRSKAELLQTLADAGIPVENQLKLTLPGGRQRNRQGVRLAALPAGLGEAPTAPPEPPPRAPAEAVAGPLPGPAQVTVHGG